MTIDEIINDPSKLEKIYSEFLSLPESYKTTIFDVLNIVGSENIISNLLSFLLDPTQDHGFGDSWINSLLDSWWNSGNIKDASEIAVEKGSFVKIRREYPTKKGRIDIFIEFENVVIVIENKIYHTVLNDLGEYRDFITKEFKPLKKKCIFILLTLRAEEQREEFINIQYSNFLSKIKVKIGNLFTGINNNYLGLIKDFINNIDNISGDNFKMEKAEFFMKKYEIIRKLNSELDDFMKNEFGTGLNLVFRKVTDYLNNESNFRNLGEWHLRDEGKSSWKIINNNNYKNLKFFDFNFEKLLSEHKYVIQLSTNSHFTTETNLTEELRNYCNEQGIIDKIQKRGLSDWGKKHHVFIGRKYDFINSSILELGESIIRKLKEDWEPVCDEIKMIMDKARDLDESIRS